MRFIKFMYSEPEVRDEESTPKGVTAMGRYNEERRWDDRVHLPGHGTSGNSLTIMISIGRLHLMIRQPDP